VKGNTDFITVKSDDSVVQAIMNGFYGAETENNLIGLKKQVTHQDKYIYSTDFITEFESLKDKIA
jgi:hypothetical protein